MTYVLWGTELHEILWNNTGFHWDRMVDIQFYNKFDHRKSHNLKIGANDFVTIEQCSASGMDAR